MKSSRLTWVIGLLAALVVSFVALLLFAPRSYRVERSITVERSRADVWRAVADLGRWRSWNPALNQDPKMQLTNGPSLHGVGAWQSWQSERLGHGRIQFMAVDSSAGQLTYTIAYSGRPPSTGTLRLSENGTDTRVTWRMSGELDSPASRAFGLMMDSMLGPDFEEGLLSLKRLIEAPASD
jgi:hypothetical protein